MQDAIDFSSGPGLGSALSRHWRAAILVGLLSALLFSPAYETFVEANKKDFAVVAREADQIRNGEPLGATHFLAPTSIAGLLHLAPGMSPLRATWLLMVLTQAATATLSFALLRPLLETHKAADLRAAVGSFALQFVAPIAIFSLAAKKLYSGYFNSHNLHNPSSHLLEPMALILFFSFAYAWPRSEARGLQYASVAIGLGLLHVLSLVTKPSFSLVFVPALLGLCALALLTGRSSVDAKLVLSAGALPFLAVSAWQFRGTFSENAFASQPRGIELRPFQIMLDMTSPAMIPLNILASVAFPLIVLHAAISHKRISAELLLAWIAYFGAVLLALFVVDGVVEIVDGEKTLSRWRAGNFWWSIQIAGFVLFVASLRELLRLKHDLSRTLMAVSLGLLALHAGFGLLRWGLHASGSVWDGWN